MSDDWFGHRHPLTGEKIRDRDEWTEWDYLLLNAYQTIEDWTDKDGLLAYEVDDPQGRVIVNAKKKINQFDRAKEARTGGKNYKPDKGEYFVPDVKLHDPEGEWPTLREFIEAQVAELDDD